MVSGQSSNRTVWRLPRLHQSLGFTWRCWENKETQCTWEHFRQTWRLGCLMRNDVLLEMSPAGTLRHAVCKQGGDIRDWGYHSYARSYFLVSPLPSVKWESWDPWCDENMYGVCLSYGKPFLNDGSKWMAWHFFHFCAIRWSYIYEIQIYFLSIRLNGRKHKIMTIFEFVIL